MLAFVPVAFDAYRQLAPRLWPVMQALVAHADRAGRCWPSVRRIADLTGVPRSTVSRYLAVLERAGHLSRRRRPGGVYTYRIAACWLPAAVSQHRAHTVPAHRPEETTIKNISDSHDDSFKWRARLRQWREFGQWVASFGPRPGEPGCRVPEVLLQGT